MSTSLQTILAANNNSNNNNSNYYCRFLVEILGNPDLFTIKTSWNTNN
jgi:hypothetical protein